MVVVISCVRQVGEYIVGKDEEGGVFAELGVLDGVVVRCEKGKMCSANVT